LQFAEQLGRVVGTVQAKADGWLDPQTLQAQISSVRDAAAGLLTQISGVLPNTPTGSAKKVTRSRGPVDAPGKRHRKPAPRARGVKHSDERIAKLRVAASNRIRRKG
jgi:hypothetical protein